MRFEHLVQVNDPLMPLLPQLTREQLWQGLVLRAEQPMQFVLGLSGCEIHSRSKDADETTLARTLDFGSFAVHDRVVLTPRQRSQTRTDAGPTWPRSRLTITIEEPQPEQLFLRFLYEFEGPDETGQMAAETDELRRQAYRSADLDTVARIRTLAESNRLG
ncbi:MAG: SRPBCC family protein [Gemmatimonadota bacterium]